MLKLFTIIFLLSTLSIKVFATEDSYRASRLNLSYPESSQSASRSIVDGFNQNYNSNPAQIVYGLTFVRSINEQPHKAAGILRAAAYAKSCSPNCDADEMRSEATKFQLKVQKVFYDNALSDMEKDLVVADLVEQSLSISDGETDPFKNALKLTAKIIEGGRHEVNSDIKKLQLEEATQYYKYGFNKELAPLAYNISSDKNLESAGMFNDYVKQETGGRVSVKQSFPEAISRNPDVKNDIVAMDMSLKVNENVELSNKLKGMMSKFENIYIQAIADNKTEHEATQLAIQNTADEMKTLKNEVIAHNEKKAKEVEKSILKGQDALGKKVVNEVKKIFDDATASRELKETKLKLMGAVSPH